MVLQVVRSCGAADDGYYEAEDGLEHVNDDEGGSDMPMLMVTVLMMQIHVPSDADNGKDEDRKDDGDYANDASDRGDGYNDDCGDANDIDSAEGRAVFLAR